MNYILIITVDVTLYHCTYEKQSAVTCTKMRRNEQNLGLHIINGLLFFLTLIKMHGYSNSTQLSRGIRLQGGNVIPAARLIMFIISLMLILRRSYSYSIVQGAISICIFLIQHLVQSATATTHPLRLLDQFGYWVGLYPHRTAKSALRWKSIFNCLLGNKIISFNLFFLGKRPILLRAFLWLAFGKKVYHSHWCVGKYMSGRE